MILAVAIVWVVALSAAVVAWKVQRLSRGEDIPTTGPLNRLAHRWHRIARAERGETSSELLAQIRAERTAHVQKGAAGHLQERFAEYQAGRITLQQYRADIIEEWAEIEEEREALRDLSNFFDEENTEDERLRIASDMEEVRWRLEWVEQRLADEAARPDVIEGSGKWARFSYEDNDGAQTKREIVNWSTSGRYLVGFDRVNNDERTFRLDRISHWVAG